MSSVAWTPPERFDEYRIVRRLGGGNMGHVYVALDTLLEREVAIKFVLAVDNPIAHARFLIEARAIARLQHANVVAVHRVGEVLGQPYIVSELVRGQPLDKLPTPVGHELLLRIATDLARALAAAHRHGVLHRDLKPSNAILGTDGVTKLLDFGLAKLDLGPSVPGGRKFSRSVTELERLSKQETAAERLDVTAADLARSTVTNADSRELTARGELLGTPLYLCPEAWLDEPFSPRSDLYSLGALLFQLATGRPPHDAPTIAALADVVTTTDAPPVRTHAEVDPGLAAIIDRCLAREPEDRFASADALCAALAEVASRRSLKIPAGNPYRGLHPFGIEHRDLFQGRATEIQAVIERLRLEPIVVIAGDSGVGKSSFVRAGLIPAILDGALGSAESWTAHTFAPGRHPLTALIAALAQHLGEDVDTIMGGLADDSALGRRIAVSRSARGGLLLLIDQLEELVDQSESTEASRVAELIAELAGPWPGIRIVATVRSDRLTRVASLPGLRDIITRSLYLLPPLDERAIRDAIVGPARLAGVEFESSEVVDVLVEAGRTPGSLPLLQFTLARLWEARDHDQRVITGASLERLGGVVGALSRHADSVIAALLPADRELARQILTRLVAPDGTRMRRPLSELPGRSEDTRRVVDALVVGRLVAAEEDHYVLAHEALIRGWPALRAWLVADAHLDAVRERVEYAAREWARLDEVDDLLWAARRLGEAGALPAETLSPLAVRFLAASRRRHARSRLARYALALTVAVATASGWVGWRVFEARRLDTAIDTGRARAALTAMPGLVYRVAEQRERSAAFAAFDAARSEEGERHWANALSLAHQADTQLQLAARAIEAVISLDPTRSGPRRQLADVLFERALLAERMHDSSLVAELLERIDRAEPNGTTARGWHAPGTIDLDVQTPGTTLRLAQFSTDGPSRQLVELGSPIGPSLQLAPGSYLLRASAPGRLDTSIPFEVRRGARASLSIWLPDPKDVPAGMVYVPPGETYTGSAGVEILRTSFFGVPPLHRRAVDGFLIARDETTIGDWIAFLEQLSETERARRMPRPGPWGTVKLTRLWPGHYQFSMMPGSTELTAESGSRFVHPGRSLRRESEWTRFPVSGITLGDLDAYARWLSASGRVPGARACSELEWQRAARGADDRLYPHGDELVAGDANIVPTYGEAGIGLDEVGTFPRTTSVFGVRDLTGNVWELTRHDDGPEFVSVRGGSGFTLALESRLDNRVSIKSAVEEFHGLWVGARICAPPPRR